MTENNNPNNPLEIKAVNVTVDVKEAILRILINSDQSFLNWRTHTDGNIYVREMNANNQNIKILLEAIK